ncbi:MAG: D-alanine--D-alanine ligase [Patescibacteria group bacterium]
MKTVVGVLRGGPSSEYEVSLKTGAAVLKHLHPERFDTRDIFVDRKGSWHVHGAEATPEKALRGVDVVFNAMHGEYGEDGQVQRVLDTLNVPYTGSGAHASSIAFDKHRTKEAVKKLGVKTPRALVLDTPGDFEDMAFEIFRTFPHPAFVKPAIGGSSVGATLAENYHALAWGLERAFAVAPKVLVEEYIKGKEATVGVIDDFRNEKSYALMPIEIIPAEGHSFFSYDAKYGGKSIERVPGNFANHEKEELMNTARTVHEGLGLSHYSRSDFIVSPRGIYFLEVNTLPGLTDESLLPKAVAAVGSRLPDFLEHVLTLAQRGNSR